MCCAFYCKEHARKITDREIVLIPGESGISPVRIIRISAVLKENRVKEFMGKCSSDAESGPRGLVILTKMRRKTPSQVVFIGRCLAENACCPQINVVKPAANVP